jgi:spore coat polysaccharide biosynthesis protein SpsF
MSARAPKLAVVVQARMSSRRLPGKVLLPLIGKPLLAHALDRLCRGQPLPVVVATSRHVSDDPLAEFCQGLGIPCLRGPLDNVAARFLLAAEELNLDAFVRVCGDSPLIDPALVERAARLFLDQRPHLAGNVYPRTYPQGQSVEVVDTETFRRALPDFSQPDELEHVTLHFYRRAAQYNIANFSHQPDLSQVRLVVDTRQDLERMAALMERMAGPVPQDGLEAILELERSTPALSPAGSAHA